MTGIDDPLRLRWAFFTTGLVGLFGSALALGLAETVREVLFLVFVALGVSAFFLPGVEERLGDDRLQFGAVFLAMGVSLLVLLGGSPGAVLFLVIGALFVGLCLRDRHVGAEDATAY